MAAPAAKRLDLDLKKFRRLLDAERERITADLRRLDEQNETGGETGEPSNYDQHEGDQGTELFLREQDDAIETGMKGELDRVEAALHKIEHGGYGYCERCGKEIPADRLEVLPSALHCIQCASDVAF